MSEALILEKLDAILGAMNLGTTGQAPQAPDAPELAAFQVKNFDGETINEDGSTWTLDQGKPVGLIYGYITKAKDPVQWAMMVAAVGGDEARLESWLASNGGPYTRYKIKPLDYLKDAVGGEPLHRLNYVLSNPLPPAPPSA